MLLSEKTSVECGPSAVPLELPIPDGAGEWNAVRSAEDVYHDEQRVTKYTIQALDEVAQRYLSGRDSRRWYD